MNTLDDTFRHGEGRLDKKVAVITGGASGIGRATVELFVREGANVVIADVQDEKGEELASILGPHATFLHTDVSSEVDVIAVINRTMEKFGRLDCIFNNAWIGGARGPIELVRVEDFDRTVAVLLRGVFLGIKHSALIMKRQGSGSIINNASTAGLQTGYGPHIYSAAKAAVVQLTRSVAMELGEAGVRVNCVCPGYIATPILGRGFGLTGKDLDQAVEQIKPIFTKLQPIRRAGVPEDVARAVLWLASDESSFVNGHALVIDGGVTGGKMWSDYQSLLGRIGSQIGAGGKKC